MTLNNPSLKYLKTSKSGSRALSYNISFNFKPLSLQTHTPVKEDSNMGDTGADEGYVSPVKEIYSENIWDVASNLSISSRYTWTSLDKIGQLKETPFACESGPKTLHKLQKIVNVIPINYINLQFDSCSEEIIISQENFIKYLKCMLGMYGFRVFYIILNSLYFRNQSA